MKRRFVVYDNSLKRAWYGLSLKDAWWAGSVLLRGVFTATRGVSSWEEALIWLQKQAQFGPIDEVQIWCHGKWGAVHLGDSVLSSETLTPTSPLYQRLEALRSMTDIRLWWFRSCETFGGEAGQIFATAWANWWQAKVAGHTHRIDYIQSGLHWLEPGALPQWSNWEGIAQGTPKAPRRAFDSTICAYHTIHCLQHTLPQRF